jgi:glucose-1-phosphate adenylyltransferase
VRTLAANGVRVDGTSERSILFPGVVIEPGAVVRDSILMHGTVVGRGAVVERVIADKGARVGADARVGGSLVEGVQANVVCPEHLSSGLTLLGKSAHVAAGAVVGRNCRVDPEVTEAMWSSDLADGNCMASPPGASPSHGYDLPAAETLKR